MTREQWEKWAFIHVTEHLKIQGPMVAYAMMEVLAEKLGEKDLLIEDLINASKDFVSWGEQFLKETRGKK